MVSSESAAMADQIDNIFVKRTAVYPENYKGTQFSKYFRNIYLIPAIFGYYFLPFPISKFRLFRVIFIIYALTISIGFSYLVLSGVKDVNRSPYVFVAVEYVATVSLLLLLNVDTRKQFIKSIEQIDEELHIDGSYYYRLKKITLVVVMIAVVTRFFYSITLCYVFKLYCNEPPYMGFTSAFILISVDTNQIPRLIAFFMIKYRMSLLRKRVENLFQNDTVSVVATKTKRKTLKFYQDVYENILDSLDIVSGQINPLFLLSLVCSFPKIMLLLYNIIVLHQKGVLIVHLLMLGLEAVQWGIIPCLPGIVFEMTRAQVDKMNLCLLKRYKDCNDYGIRTEIKEFLNYIELRPCQYTLFRLISIDNSLPVGLFHLCTSYLIVLIQFSHLFENNIG